MSLSPIDFVAANVEIIVKYVDCVPTWCSGVVTEVHEYGIEDGSHYVECSIQFDNEEDLTVETLWDYDYATNNDDAWKFTSKFTPLVTNVMSVVNSVEDLDGESDTDATSLYDTEDEAEGSESEEYDSEDEHDDVDEEVQHLPRRRPSFLNQFFATLFGLTPLLATFAVVYNGRDDIINALRNRYC